jgi:iron-sulfur cluster assembly accessory protein
MELTTNAIKKIKEFSIAEPGKVFRLRLISGGCNGFEYSVGFSEQEPTDMKYCIDDAVVIIDPLSDSMLAKIKVDYVESLAFSGFKFDNPDAISKCGCGQSFSL